MPRLMLLDANGLIYRAYFALFNTPLTTSRGELVNAVFGFWSIVLRGFQDVRPEYVIACFDLAGPTFRHEAFADYKATRQKMPDDLRDQFPKVRQLIEAFRIPIFQLEGFEADDLIGTLTRQAEAEGIETTIVSGDLDMLQLVSERTHLMTTRGGVQQTVVYDPARIEERYGLRPEQMVDFKALKGDTTDNIPGVPGVGDKTAAELLQRFGTLDALFERLDEVKREKLRQALAEHRERVLASRELVTIRRDLPVALELGDARLGEYDRSEVIRLFRDYEFRSLVERLPAVSGEEVLAPGELLRRADASSPIPAVQVAGRAPATTRAGSLVGQGSGLQLSLDFDRLEAATTGGRADGAKADDATGGGTAAATVAAPAAAGPPEAAAAPRVELHETDPRARLEAAIRGAGVLDRFEPGVDVAGWLSAQPMLGLGIAIDDPRPRRGRLLGLAMAGADGRIVAADAERAEALLEALLAADRPVAGHDLKRLLGVELARRDPDGTLRNADTLALPAAAFDTQIAAYLLNASLRSQTLTDICAERLSLELPAVGTLGGAEHAAVEALAADAVRRSMEPDLATAGLDRLLREIELPLIPVLARMEATGVAIDRAALDELARTFSVEIQRLEREIHESVGHEFNLGSPKQLEQVLFFELDLPRGKRTKTGYSTDASVLEELRGAHPMIEKLLDWRVYTKLKSTYVDALPALLDPRTGRLHTTFHQAVASTGRLSSSDPNLQNIPIRTDLGRRIRRAFVAGDPERTLLAADYSQIELRILAHVSGDAGLTEAFARHADIHRETAARVLHKDPGDVSHAERSMAKMVNFGIAYGMSDYGLSTRAGIPRAEAQEFINRYFATYSGISYYMLHIRDLARQQGYVTTLLGRRRWIPELSQRNPNLRAAGERMAINMPIQGTAADIMKIAMIRVAERLRRGGSGARMLLQVHDELLLEVPRDEVPVLAPVVREVMSQALPLDVPLDVDVKVGDDWESMTPLDA
ncbi:MAG TPA: DNA polymerase I [Candidatus Limnocylindrales bacterium]|nr:DNA polymerase I [Candidatus Limnocylindrales bacterium]